MKTAQALLVVSALFTTIAIAKPAKRTYSTHDYYVVELTPRAGASLDDVSTALGVEIVERAGELPDHWLVRRQKHALDRRNPVEDPVRRALNTFRKRSEAEPRFWSRSTQHQRRVAEGVKYLARQELRQRIKRGAVETDEFEARSPLNGSSIRDVSARFGIHDPEFAEQWYLVDEEYPDHTMNVTGLWEMGVTGQGVISALVDDGLDYDSDDLRDNFHAAGSHDFNDHTALPTPKLPDDHHGTRCAGQIAAAKNDVCGVGIAHGSKVAGLRILSGPISDVDEAAALNYGFQETSIYSCSWGPPDNGRAMDAPNYLVEKAIVNGVNNGRGGKGSVFVFASGNGARWGDQCNFDGYTNSIYSITVGAIDHMDLHPPYSEACAANMVVAYSSGSGKSISTTDVGKNQCTSSHSGTSAAAPNAVGVFALALSVRPDLTWRDMQHLAVNTAVHINPNDRDWEMTAAGRPFSYKYGYGRLDGYAYVQAARTWNLVKPQAWLALPPIRVNGGMMTASGHTEGGKKLSRRGVESKVVVTPEAMKERNVEKLEHITVRVWITHEKRGDVEVELVSPNSVKSVLAAPRRLDEHDTGFSGWQFSTIKHWDENPIGEWTLRVRDQGSYLNEGIFLGWTMSLWGSSIDASKAVKLEVHPHDHRFPPLNPDDAAAHPASPVDATKTHERPTGHLPSDHIHATGEAEHAAFATDAPGATSTDRPMEEVQAHGTLGQWFANTMSGNNWLFAALGALIPLVLGAVLFICISRRRRTAQYERVTDDEELSVPLTMAERRRTARVSAARATHTPHTVGDASDEEIEPEETPLRGGLPSGGDVGLHQDFLQQDDADGQSASRESR